MVRLLTLATLSLGMLSFCQQNRSIDTAGGGSSNLTAISVTLPAKTGLPQALSDALSGYSFTVSPEGACPGFQLVNTVDAYQEKLSLGAKLMQNCDYVLQFQAGVLLVDPTTKVKTLPAEKVIYQVKREIKRAELAGKNSLSLTLVLERTSNLAELSGPGQMSTTGTVDMKVEVQFPQASVAPSNAPVADILSDSNRLVTYSYSNFPLQRIVFLKDGSYKAEMGIPPKSFTGTVADFSAISAKIPALDPPSIKEIGRREMPPGSSALTVNVYAAGKEIPVKFSKSITENQRPLFVDYFSDKPEAKELMILLEKTAAEVQAKWAQP